jgi:hypothetical protein
MSTEKTGRVVIAHYCKPYAISGFLCTCSNFYKTRRPEKNMKREDQQDATIRCLLFSVSTCFGHHYAHLQKKRGPVTAFGVLFWFCWMWLVAVVGRCLAGCEQ